MNSLSDKPLIWYLAAGYGLPAGIEAHVLHYATEMRNHGFRTAVVVFKRLPRKKHRFLQALQERQIPVASLEMSHPTRLQLHRLFLFVPWLLYVLLKQRIRPAVNGFRIWTRRRHAIGQLRRKMAIESPAILHVFGRLPHDVWRELPPRQTIFHEMMTGTVDGHWTKLELSEFKEFAEHAARYFAPGIGVAENVHREFGIQRRIDTIFTMCPDAASCAEEPTSAVAEGHADNLRFGVICRLSEQKGIKYLLDALRCYRDRHGNVNFVFGGVGPLKQMIRQYVEKNDLKGVRIQRVVNAEEFLRQIDLFVHPSIGDAMPVAIAEALMCARPCIVCDVGGVGDLVRDGVEGRLLEPHSTEQILSAMEQFREMSAQEFQHYRERARQRYEDVCRPQSVGNIVAAHYHDIINATAN